MPKFSLPYPLSQGAIMNVLEESVIEILTHQSGLEVNPRVGIGLPKYSTGFDRTVTERGRSFVKEDNIKFLDVGVHLRRYQVLEFAAKVFDRLPAFGWVLQENSHIDIATAHRPPLNLRSMQINCGHSVRFKCGIGHQNDFGVRWVVPGLTT